MSRDQTYCVACGERRGALPAGLAAALAALRPQTTAPATIGAPPLVIAPPVDPIASFLAGLEDLLENATLPSPRIAALAVMTLLAFGVVLGSVVGATTTGTPVYVLGPPAQPAGPASAEVPPAAAVPGETLAAAPLEEAVAPAGEAAPQQGEVAAAKVNRVWLIVLSGQGYADTFGNTQSQSYLTSDLAGKGLVFQNHFAVAQSELANSIALVSGQGPTWQTLANCPRYTDLSPGTLDAATGLATGDGCVYPESVRTISDVVAATGKSTYAYIEDIDNRANGRENACKAPAAGSEDADHVVGPGNAYASWSNPFVYFKSFVGGANCQFQVGGIQALEADLLAGRSPAFSLIVPNRCNSGRNEPCAPGAPTGLASTDGFLQRVVPKIMGSKDFLDGGLIAITFDGAPRSTGDVSACCGQPEFANLATPPTAQPDPTGQTGATGQTEATGEDAGILPPPFSAKTPEGTNAGGGKVGLLMLSPLIKEGSVNSTEEANHFSLLLTIENWLGTEKLGHTADPALTPLPDSILNKSAGG